MRVGDRVILARPGALSGRYGIPEDCFGKEYKISILYPNGDGATIEGHGFLFTVCVDMLAPNKPLTPFERLVDTYIQSELPR